VRKGEGGVWDDDNGRSGWQFQDSQPRGSSQKQGLIGRRGVLLGVGALVTLTAIGLLTACLYGLAAPLLTGVLAGSPTVSSAATSAPSSNNVQQQIAATATATPGSSDWDTFTVYDGGFHVDVPGVLSSSHGCFINDFSGQGVDLAYNGATLSTPLQRLEAGTKVSVLYSTKITSIDICPQCGTPVQAGAGGVHIAARERDQGDTVYVNPVLNGVAIEIHMTSGSGQSVLPQYAEIWNHMLASIAPPPGLLASTTHPCG
jgi:hypothetical protein